MAVLERTKELQGELDALVDRVFGRYPFYTEFRMPRIAEVTAPAMDLYEKNGKYVVELAVPGFEPKEISAEVNNDIVTITGSHEETKERKEARYYCKEMRKGSFTRTITLPQEVDASTADAKVENGVLYLTLTPLKPITTKKIAIKGAV